MPSARTSWTALALLLALLLSLSPGAAAGDNKPEPAPNKTTDLVLSASEKAILEVVNAERKKMDLAPLQPSAKLFQMARAHAQNMARQSALEHTLDGKNPADRARQVGYRGTALGENIALGPQAATGVLRIWMNSKPHRENILNPAFTEAGVGSAMDAVGGYYWVLVFGRPFNAAP